MKKITKVVVGMTMAAAVAATAGVLAGCGAKDKTGEAYGLVHGAGYVGYSKIVVNGDKVNDLVLTEVCLPDHVKAGTAGTSNESADAAVAAIVAATGVSASDYVVVSTSKTADNVTTYTATPYYKTVKIGDTTFTYDATDGYKTGSTTIKAWLATEANCKTYYEAVTSNSVKVTVGTTDKTDILNKASLSKEENGYWDGANVRGLGWKVNRQKTVDYVKANGVSKMSSLAVDDTTKTWKDSAGVDTGATWTDMNSTKEGSLSYVQLIQKAYEAAK